MSIDTSPANLVDDLDDEEPEPCLVDLAELVDGQGPIQDCASCCHYITQYGEEWLHVINPALTGTDDHDATP